MKVVITESKRKNVVIKWLDDNYGDLEKYVAPGSFRYIHYINNNKTVFMFNRNTGLVTINDLTLKEELKYMFGLDGYDLNNVLIPWLEQRYNLHVERVRYTDLM
jgi:hypothetical protein